MKISTNQMGLGIAKRNTAQLRGSYCDSGVSSPSTRTGRSTG